MGADVREHFEPEVLFDGALPKDSGSTVLRNVMLSAGPLSVVHGEVDALHTSYWRFGFFHDTTFTIFSYQGRICHVSLIDGKPCIELFRHSHHATADSAPRVTIAYPDHATEPLHHHAHAHDPAVRVIPIASIKNVCVRVSPAPYITRTLFLTQHDSKHEVEVLVDELEDVDPERVSDPLAMLMTTTEWLVKAAAGLSLVIKRFGGNAPMRLSRALMPEHNEWIAKRNKAWRDAAARAKKEGGGGGENE